MLPEIRVGTVELSTYWMMYAFGVIAIFALLQKNSARYHLTRLQAAILSVLVILFGTGGVKVLAILQNIEKAKAEGISAVGQSFFGAVFLIPVGMSLCAGFFRMSKSAALDAAAPCIAVMIGLMRVGCFLGGCCGGWEAELFGFRFHWPTQAMESIGDFAILGLLLQMESGKEYEGKRYAVFMTGYGCLRFLVEFLRDTEKGMLGLGAGQWFAAVSVIIGLAAIMRCEKAGSGV